MKDAQEIKEVFEKLTADDQEKLLNELLRTYELNGQTLEAARQEVNSKKKKPCPHCDSEKVHKRGKQKGVQMYYCNGCSKWFSETTGTPLFDIKLKHKWQAYINCMQQGKSLRKIRDELDICIQTSLNWRHKILSTLKSFEPQVLDDIVEIDELELPINNKGERNLQRSPRKRSSDFKRNEYYDEVTTVQVVTAVQRGGGKILKAVETKRVTTEHLKKALDGKIADNTTVITDKHPSYKSFVKTNETLKHKALLSKEHVSKKDKKVHLQNVNSTHSQLRKFLRPFNGVSSKYLQNYLNWFAYAEKLKEEKHSLKQWLIAILLSPQAYNLFLQFKQNAVIIRT